MGECVIKLYNLTDLDSWPLHKHLAVCQCHPRWIREGLMVRSTYKNGFQGKFSFFKKIVKLSVMEFSKRTMKRKQRRQKIAINLQMQATARFTARFVTVLGQWSAGETRRDHPFSGVRGQFGLHAHLLPRLLWIDCQLNLNCAKLCMHFLMQAIAH